MRRFRFRLERLARLAAQRERLAQREVAAVAAQAAELERGIAALGRDREAALAPDVPVRLGAALALACESRARVARTQLASVEAERERLSHAWRERRAEAEALRAVRERQRAEWRRDRVRAERDAVDELVAASRAVPRSAGEEAACR